MTKDVRAYEHYLRAWGLFRRFGPGNLDKARELFRRAIEIEPDYAAAWAGLSISAAFLYMYYDSRREICDEADEASRTALRWGPELAEAYTARGLAHSLASRYEEAEAAFEESILRDAQRFEPYYCYARVCMQQGKRHKAAALFRKAMQIEPDDFQSPLLLAQVYLEIGDEARARDAARLGVETAERHLELHPDDPRALSMPLGTLHWLGRQEQAREWAQRALAVDGENPGTLYNVACHFAVAGQPDRALDCLEKAVLPGSVISDWIEQDPELDSLRGRPRFDALLDRLRGQTECAPADPTN
jgi:tetratricopeptide (TPR) repeat protein